MCHLKEIKETSHDQDGIVLEQATGLFVGIGYGELLDVAFCPVCFRGMLHAVVNLTKGHLRKKVIRDQQR